MSDDVYVRERYVRDFSILWWWLCVFSYIYKHMIVCVAVCVCVCVCLTDDTWSSAWRGELFTTSNRRTSPGLRFDGNCLMLDRVAAVETLGHDGSVTVKVACCNPRVWSAVRWEITPTNTACMISYSWANGWQVLGPSKPKVASVWLKTSLSAVEGRCHTVMNILQKRSDERRYHQTQLMMPSRQWGRHQDPKQGWSTP